MINRRRRPSAMSSLLGGAAIFVGIATHGVDAVAQDASLESLKLRLDRLERDVGALNRRPGALPASAAGPSVGESGSVAGGPAAARLEVRLSALEGDLRATTGQIEELNHLVRQLNQRLDTVFKDLEFRLGRVEQQADLGLGPDSKPLDSSDPTQRVAAPTGGAAAGGARQAAKDEAARTALVVPPVALRGAPTGALSGPGGTLPKGTPEEQYAYAFGLLRMASYSEAEVALKQFMEQHPDSQLADNARYWLGETYYVRGDYVQAAETFLDAYQQGKQGPKAADALLKLAMSLGRLDKKDEACTTLRELGRAVPDAPLRVKKKSADERKRIGCN